MSIKTHRYARTLPLLRKSATWGFLVVSSSGNLKMKLPATARRWRYDMVVEMLRI